MQAPTLRTIVNWAVFALLVLLLVMAARRFY